MTKPNAPYVAGALDLGEVKARAEARAQAEKAAQGAAGGAMGANGAPQDAGLAPFFEVTDENFETHLVRRSAEVPVIAMVGTSRSDMSEKLKATLKELAEEGSFSFIVGYIDADARPQIAQAFGVKNLPTTIAVAGGQPITNFEGGQPREALEPWVEALVSNIAPQLNGPGPELQAAKAAWEAGERPGAAQAGPQEDLADPRLGVAEEALNAGDFDAAIAAYEEILAAEPGNKEIKQARDTTMLLKRLNPAERAEDPIALADSNPDDVQAQLDAADAEVVAGAPDKAFDRLIEAMKRTAGDDKTVLRERVLELFGLFEAGDPRVLAARTKLASALY